MKNDADITISIDSSDTICAISTPPGIGGIAVIRVSGPMAIAVADRVWQGKPLADTSGHTVRFGRIIDPGREGELLDEGVATVFRAPASFTGEDVVELSVHGSRYVQRRLLEVLVSQGARMAEAGEFTRRAFANGKMDLAQAEAVADVIASNSRAAHRIAASQMRGGFSKRLEELRGKLLDLASLLELELDFSEEEVEFASRQHLRDIAQQIHTEVTRLEKSFSAGSAIKEGIPVAIIGPTNAGKSSLLNLLLGEDRAIVSDIHGTTRDTIEDTLEIGDYLFRFIDTAGIRATDDPIETLGIERSIKARSTASIIISVVDASASDTPASDVASPHPTAAPTILLLNKSDLLTSSPSQATTLSTSTPHTPYGDQASPHNTSSAQASTPSSTTPPVTTTTPTHIPFAATNPFAADSPLAATSSFVATIPFSTKTGQGLDELRDALTTIADQMRGTTDEDTILVTNLRHAQALREAAATTTAILEDLSTGLPGDLIAQDLRATLHHLSTITGTLTTPDILTSIFSRFCIGK